METGGAGVPCHDGSRCRDGWGNTASQLRACSPGRLELRYVVGQRTPAGANKSATNNLLSMTNPKIDPKVSIGHVHLKVADLDRALSFYCGILGFEVTQRYGTQAAFIAAGDYHHHIGLNTWESLGGSPPPPGSTGLFHLAILYPTRATLADALRRLLAAGISLDGASDHGVSQALYLRDPDQNGVELYWDRPREEWPCTPEGKLAMFTRPLDLKDLLDQAP